MSAILVQQRFGVGERSYEKQARSLTKVRDYRYAAFISLHIPLALLAHQFHLVATIHAGTALLIGLWLAATKATMRRIACVGAYVVGAEVLWRMTEASVPWEFGKYGTALIFVLALSRHGRLRMPLLPVIYFALLLPAIVPTVMQDYFNLEAARQIISFNLSGPFALVVCAWFFSHVRFTLTQLQDLLVAIIGPAVSIGVITFFGTMTAKTLTWGSQSNFVSSGGFGPNQVSAALGLGALMALLFLSRGSGGRWLKLLMFVVMLFLSVECALTFSRGGMFGALIAGLVAVFLMARDRKARLQILIVSLATILVAALIVFPRINHFTGGALAKRFENTSTTGRSRIVQSDLRMWSEHPILGVGVGMSFFRDEGWAAAHTEFTRLLAEHGAFGFAALCLLLFSGWQRVIQERAANGKAFTAAMISWSFLFMLDKAMRLAAPSFTFGLAFATLQSEPGARRKAARAGVR